jgi:hypothetical protein
VEEDAEKKASRGGAWGESPAGGEAGGAGEGHDRRRWKEIGGAVLVLWFRWVPFVRWIGPAAIDVADHVC